MKKKRPSLAEFQQEAKPTEKEGKGEGTLAVNDATKPVHKSVYIPPAVLDQMDLLAIQERTGPGRKKKFNTLVLEALDLLFASRGLKSISDLTDRK